MARFREDPTMKRVRITLDPGDLPLPPVYERLTVDATDIEDVRIVNWNVADPPATFLLRLRGDDRRVAAVLADDDAVDEYQVLPLTGAECHCYLTGETGPASRALFENFTRGSLLTVPPIQCHPDGRSTFTIVGADGDIQAAVDGVPEGASVTVERVGGEQVTPDGAVARLSDRQREAVEVAIATGYYDVPRTATVEDVGDELDCGTTTAAEHLRKAEAAVLNALLGG